MMVLEAHPDFEIDNRFREQLLSLPQMTELADLESCDVLSAYSKRKGELGGKIWEQHLIDAKSQSLFRAV